MINQYIQDLKLEFKNYNVNKLMQDTMAGLTVTAVALPLALAFGVSSGLGAPSGLISAIVAGLVMGGLAGASYQVSGPTGTMMAILSSTYVAYGADGVFITGLLSGLFLLISALIKFGKFVSYIPSHVITGFTSGIALIIALGQIDNFFGTKSVGTTAVEKLFSYFNLGFSPNIYSVIIGSLVVLIMVIWPKKWNSKIPASLAALIIALIINSYLNLPVKLVGTIPKTIILKDRLSLEALSFSKVFYLISPALSIAVLCMIESLLCGASAGKIKNETLNSDRELVAQGIGNLLIPLFGGLPASAVLARTSVALNSGGQTRLVSIIQSLGLLFCMFFLGNYISKIPMSALAGVLFVTAWRMNEWKEIKYIFNNKFGTSIIQFTVTMVATVMFNLTIAILIGIFLAIFLFVIKNSNLTIDVSYVDLSRIKNHEISADHTYTKIVYLTGPLFFLNKDKLKSALEEIGDVKSIIFSMRAVTSIDESAMGELKEIVSKYKSNDVNVLFCAIQPIVKEMFDRSGLTKIVGEEQFFWDAIEAIKSLENNQDIMVTN